MCWLFFTVYNNVQKSNCASHYITLTAWILILQTCTLPQFKDICLLQSSGVIWGNAFLNFPFAYNKLLVDALLIAFFLTHPPSAPGTIAALLSWGIVSVCRRVTVCSLHSRDKIQSKQLDLFQNWRSLLDETPFKIYHQVQLPLTQFFSRTTTTRMMRIFKPWEIYH